MARHFTRRLLNFFTHRAVIVCSIFLSSTLITPYVKAQTLDPAYEAGTGGSSDPDKSDCDPDGRTYCRRNCTSYVAYRLATAGVAYNDYKNLHNGGEWYGNAQARGIPVGDVAKQGAAAVIPGNPGHVAFIEKVNSNGSINVASYNGYTESFYPETNTTRYSHFIYFSNVGQEQNAGDADLIDELGFARLNHSSGQVELVSFHGAPHYTTPHTNAITSYPSTDDFKNVVPLAIDVNGDGIDELGFVRFNHSSGNTELVLYHGAPNYTTLLKQTLTSYPKIEDPQNVFPLAIDVNGDLIDELGFARLNHSSGQVELVLLHGAPNYTTLLKQTLTSYPAIEDVQNVTPIAIDTNGDNIDELGFVRSNHNSGNAELVLYHGAPDYTTLLKQTLTGYPAITDPDHVTPLALDTNGDRIDELGFIRTNHSSGNTELAVYHGSPDYITLLAQTLTGYPTVSDPWNVVPLGLHFP